MVASGVALRMTSGCADRDFLSAHGRRLVGSRSSSRGPDTTDPEGSCGFDPIEVRIGPRWWTDLYVTDVGRAPSTSAS